MEERERRGAGGGLKQSILKQSILTVVEATEVGALCKDQKELLSSAGAVLITCLPIEALGC